MAKSKEDLSLTGAVNQVYDFFFDTVEEVVQAITPNTEVVNGSGTNGVNVEQPKRNKSIVNPFVTDGEEKGAKVKRGKSSNGVGAKSEPERGDGTEGEGEAD